MKFSTSIFVAPLVALCLLGCGDDTSNGSGPDNVVPALMTFAHARFDTTVYAAPGAFIVLHNTVMPRDTDTAAVYVWEVVSRSTVNNTWTWSVCDPQQCGTTNGMRSEFRFANGLPGLFYVDWMNRDLTLADVAAGVCSLTVRIFPVDGGDTVFYTSVMRVNPASLALEQEKIDTMVNAAPGIEVRIDDIMTPRVADSSARYGWRVMLSSAVSPSWTWSVCDPAGCKAEGVSTGEFTFAGAQSAPISVKWRNSDSDIGTMVDGACSLFVAIYPVGGGDTTLLPTTLYVLK